MPKITELYAFIVQNSPKDEGLTAFRTMKQWVPMVCADKERVDSLREIAQSMSTICNQEIILAKFSIREDLEVIKPE
jgi:hypothetical protein